MEAAAGLNRLAKWDCRKILQSCLIKKLSH